MAICKGTRVDGAPCRQPSVRGTEYCFWHDPAHAEAAEQALAIADQRRITEVVTAAGHGIPEGIDNRGGLERLLSVALAEVLSLPASPQRSALLLRGIQQALEPGLYHDENDALSATIDVYGQPGRKVKFDRERKDQMIHLITQGATRTEACRAVGVGMKTLERHELRYPGFADAMRRAQMEPNDRVVRSLYNAALAGNVRAIEVWLYNKLPREWAAKFEQRVTFEVDQNTLMEFVDILQMAGTPPEVMERIRAELVRRAEGRTGNNGNAGD